MQLKTYLLLGQYLISCNFLDLTLAVPIVGQDVRHAQIGEFPSVVSIMKNDNEIYNIEVNQICTGVLITNFHVLTAEHCLEDVKINETQAIVGSRDLRSGRRHPLAWWVGYEDWARRHLLRIEFQVNDISIIKLREAVSSNIEPATLSTVLNKNAYGSVVVTAGWGVTITEEHPRFMRTVDLKIISNRECEKRIKKEHGSVIPIHDRLLCSIAEPFALLLPGDSGAPIFHRNKVIAIHRSTAPHPNLRIHPKKVNIHTSIDYYRRFILHVLSSGESWN